MENETIWRSLISWLSLNLTIKTKKPNFIKPDIIALEQKMPTGYLHQFLDQRETISEQTVLLLRNITL